MSIPALTPALVMTSPSSMKRRSSGPRCRSNASPVWGPFALPLDSALRWTGGRQAIHDARPAHGLLRTRPRASPSRAHRPPLAHGSSGPWIALSPTRCRGRVGGRSLSLTGWFPLVVLGGFGPAGAAAAMLRLTGQPLRPWLRGLLAWRVRPRFYAYALLLPAAVYGAVNLALQVLGTGVDWVPPARPDARLPRFPHAHGNVVRRSGGTRMARIRASPSTGAAHTVCGHHAPLSRLGVWHVPLYGPAGFVVPLVLAFFYTWLFNRTGSVLMRLLLHGSFTAAQDELLLTADSVTVDAVILGIYIAAAAAVLLLTKGRLERPRQRPRHARRARPERSWSWRRSCGSCSVASPSARRYGPATAPEPGKLAAGR